MDEQSSLWLKISGLLRFARNDGHCEERSDEATCLLRRSQSRKATIKDRPLSTIIPEAPFL